MIPTDEQLTAACRVLDEHGALPYMARSHDHPEPDDLRQADEEAARRNREMVRDAFAAAAEVGDTRAAGLREALAFLNGIAKAQKQVNGDDVSQEWRWYNATNCLLMEIAQREGKSIDAVVAGLLAAG